MPAWKTFIRLPTGLGRVRNIRTPGVRLITSRRSLGAASVYKLGQAKGESPKHWVRPAGVFPKHFFDGVDSSDLMRTGRRNR